MTDCIQAQYDPPAHPRFTIEPITDIARAGGTRAPFIDCYWTGAYQQTSNQVWYGRLDPE